MFGICEKYVSLLVRLWVEITMEKGAKCLKMSASSWGCELKWIYRYCLVRGVRPSASSWGCELKLSCCFWSSLLSSVSLLVRLWVEIFCKAIFNWSRKSASSWGCELKWCCRFLCSRYCSQPPREAVSWNVQDQLSAAQGDCQPPREAVSWNILSFLPSYHRQSQPPREAVSWNLK